MIRQFAVQCLQLVASGPSACRFITYLNRSRKLVSNSNRGFSYSDLPLLNYRRNTYPVVPKGDTEWVSRRIRRNRGMVVSNACESWSMYVFLNLWLSDLEQLARTPAFCFFPFALFGPNARCREGFFTLARIMIVCSFTRREIIVKVEI